MFWDEVLHKRIQAFPENTPLSVQGSVCTSLPSAEAVMRAAQFLEGVARAKGRPCICRCHEELCPSAEGLVCQETGQEEQEKESGTWDQQELHIL